MTSPAFAPSATAVPAVPLRSKKVAYVWTVLFVLLVAAELWLSPNYPLFWERWEIGSLITAIVFSVVFYTRLFWRELHKGLTGPQMGKVVIILIVALLCMSCATIVTCSGLIQKILPSVDPKANLPAVTLSFLASGMFCFGMIDLIFTKYHNDDEVKKEFSRGFWFNAVPVFTSFLVLLCFALLFQVTDTNHEQLKSFIGGAVAFEVLTGNTVFVILFWHPEGL